MLPLPKDDILLEEYYLIDWSKAPSNWRSNKMIELTSYEAWAANQGFALNGTTLRYIKNKPETWREE